MTTPLPQASRVIVTGAAGFIGFHVAQALLRLGHDVTGIDNLNDYYTPELKQARLAQLNALSAANTGSFHFHKLDLTSHDGVLELFANTKPDHVIHLAAQAGVRYSISNPHAYVSANVDGFLSVLEACRVHPVKHLIYASSSSVYGANTKVPFHEDDPVLEPVSLYAATKRSNELMAQTYAHLYGIQASGLRFFTVYGPWGRPDMAYFKFTRAILAGEAIDVYNNGQMQRDFTYVDDVVAAITHLLAKPPAIAIPLIGSTGTAPHLIYNIGNHTPVALGEFIAAIEKITGKTASKRYLPMQPGDVPATYADVSRLARVTGFEPSTTLETGLKRFIDWYKAFYPWP
jgi:UDP-glucuronate 4-epimerase